MASLFVVRGRNQGTHFQLRRTVERIGRDSDSDIQLLDSEVSRHHAEIRRNSDGTVTTLVDLGSSNGTRVAGNPVQRHVLRSGDRIEIGRTLMIFTGTGLPATLDAAHGVDIVQQSLDNDASQIVSSLSQSSSSPAASVSEAERSLEVIYLTAIAVGRGEDLDTVLDRILRLVFDWLDADRGCVMLKDPQTGQLQPAARCDRESAKITGDPRNDRSDDSAGGTAEQVPPAGDRSATARRPNSQARISISRTILDYVIEKKEGVRTTDAKGDDRFESAASIVKGGVREALCVPLQGRYDVVGALYIDTYSSPGRLIRSGGQPRFTDDHLRLITAIGHQAALAIEDTFFYSALVQNERLAAMGQTIATISHHVKNILQGIRGGGYLIDAGLKREDNDAVRRGWAIVERNQERISNLVMDMLSFSKEREPEKIEADLNETVGDVVELMQSHALEHGVQLGCDLATNLPPAEFDPEAIHRAVLNLVTNAIDAAAKGDTDDAQERDDEADFSLAETVKIDDDADSFDAPDASTAGDGRVFVQTKFTPDQGWIIDVIDNGTGVPPDRREKIFSLFESDKGSTGTGLGLPVSAKIMREHGGEVQVLDSPMGRGSCFRLNLPHRGTQTSEMSSQETLL